MLVPLNCNSLLNGLAAMRDAGHLQIVTVRSLKGWDDCHTVPNFRQSEQGVWCATLKQNIWLDVCETASRVEQPPHRIASVQQQQRIRGKAANIYATRMAEFEGSGAGSQGLGCWQQPTVETWTTLFKSDAQMHFATFKHGCLLRTEGFTQLYMYVGKTLSILR
jgi:hypothetical protein